MDAVYGSMQVGLQSLLVASRGSACGAGLTGRLLRQEEDEVMRQHRALGGAVQAALKRTRIKLQNMRRQAAAGERADATKKQADLIMSALHSIRPGAASVQVRAACPLCWWLRFTMQADSLCAPQVEDWDTGEVVTVPLDPNKEANDAAEALYKAARKQRRTEGAIAPVMEARAPAQQAERQSGFGMRQHTKCCSCFPCLIGVAGVITFLFWTAP